jgi:selenide,water dikinase
MLATMLLGNGAAAGVARGFDVRAVTDITGFGLAGHLLEMLRASGVDARVTLGAIPLLDGFAELSGRGVRSSLDPSNRESEHAIDGHAPELRASARYDALFDPQTSGGLLIAARPEFSDELVVRLRAAGYDRAIMIGEVLERSADRRLALAP